MTALVKTFDNEIWNDGATTKEALQNLIALHIAIHGANSGHVRNLRVRRVAWVKKGRTWYLALFKGEFWWLFDKQGKRVEVVSAHKASTMEFFE